MADLRRGSPYKYPYERCLSSYSQAAACLPKFAARLPQYHGNIDTNEGIQIQTPTESIKFVEPGTCIDHDDHAAVIFGALSTKRPHDYGLLGTASLGPMVQPDKTAEDDSSQAIAQYWQKIVANFDNPAQTIICNSPTNSLLNSSNPRFPPTRSHRRKKAAAGGGGHDHEASEECIGNLHKLVERRRRYKMKTLCSKLTSLLPEEYRKTKHILSDKLLEASKHICHLQDKVMELGKKRDELKFSATVKQISDSSCVYKNLQASQARPSNVRYMNPTIRVRKFGTGIQVNVNTFKNQIDFSSLLMLLEEAGVEVVSATVSDINDRAFYSIHSKLSDFRHFDSGVLHGRIDQLINGNLP